MTALPFRKRPFPEKRPGSPPSQALDHLLGAHATSIKPVNDRFTVSRFVEYLDSGTTGAFKRVAEPSSCFQNAQQRWPAPLQLVACSISALITPVLSRRAAGQAIFTWCANWARDGATQDVEAQLPRACRSGDSRAGGPPSQRRTASVKARSIARRSAIFTRTSARCRAQSSRTSPQVPSLCSADSTSKARISSRPNPNSRARRTKTNRRTSSVS